MPETDLSSFDIAALKAELTEDEDLKRYPYTDTTGHISIGIGRNLSDDGITPAEINILWLDDVATAAALLDQNAPWWRTLTPGRQRVMVNICFNIGWTRMRGFRKFLAAMEAGAWSTAAAELKDSLWWTQVKQRGPRTVARLMKEPPTA